LIPPSKKLINKHHQLTHTENIYVTSHVQREKDDWFINILMLKGVDIAFKYKRKKEYKNLKGKLVNITYYSSTETIAGFEVDIMKVVRIKIS